MKKFLSPLSTILVTLFVFFVATACGNIAKAYKPLAKAYKPLYDYLQSKGGSDKSEGLIDPILGTFNIKLSTGEGKIYATTTLKNSSHDYFTMTFYETDNQHIDIDYMYRFSYMIDSGSAITIVDMNASCTNLEDLSTLTIQKICFTTESGIITLKDSNPIYTKMKQKADNYLPLIVEWVSADVSVLLDDDALSVQDLYNPS